MNKMMCNIILQLQAVFVLTIFLSSCSATSQAPKVEQAMQAAGAKKIKPTTTGRVKVSHADINYFLKSVDAFVAS
jgi:hypothetical protein